MLAQGVIEPSSSPWLSPVVDRKKDGTFRLCIDYLNLNLFTHCEAHPIPRMDDTLDSLNGAKMFTTVDLRSGYWQVPMDRKDKPKTAFATQAGQFQFTRMPFGLNLAPSTFQRMTEIVLSGLNLITCLCYLDDVIIHSKDLNQHCERLVKVLSQFRQHNLRVKISKCTFAAPKVSYLGHVISGEGISPDPTKVEAVH